MNKLTLSCAALILVPSLTFGAEVHKDVRKALDYKLPENTCIKPKLKTASEDAHKLGRYDRASKRWSKCVTKYKKGLVKDFGKLQNSAKHGLTEAQAKKILGNMSNIQAALEAHDGVAKPAED